MLNANFAQPLLVEKLLARTLVVELITQRLTIRRDLRQSHLVEQHRQDAIDRRVVWQLDILPLVPGRIPDLNRDHRHGSAKYPSKQSGNA